jgi:hypothetical protein
VSGGLAHLKLRLRHQAEHHLRIAAMEEMRKRYSNVPTVEPYHESGGLFWRRIFVPLYRVLPWALKERAMHALRMTAESSGWTPPPRQPSEPWRPPAPK